MNQKTLEEVIRNNQPHQYDLSHCWGILEKGLEEKYYDVHFLRDLLQDLSSRRDTSLGFAKFKFDDDKLQVSYLGEKSVCYPNDMIYQIKNVINGYDSQDNVLLF